MAGTISVCSSRARPHIMTYAFLADVRRLHPPRRPQGAGGCLGGDRDRSGGARLLIRTASHRADADGSARREPARRPRRPSHRLHDRFASQRHRPARVDRIGDGTAHGESSRISSFSVVTMSPGAVTTEPRAIVISSSRRPTRCAGYRRRTACSASSATTTTIGDMPAAMANRGVEILKDARTRLTVRGEALDLIGLRYWTTRGRDIASVARGAAKASILLAHNPSRLKEAAALSLPLMLSGHTHGGQIVLPGFGAVAARNFPIISGVGGTRPHHGIRKSRRRNCLRADSDQLPARGRAPHAPTCRPGVTAGA